MEKLKFQVTDSIIANVLGRQNFTNKESAVLELVKNAYDAHATLLTITFNKNQLIFQDDGLGMCEIDIKNKWMMVGTSFKSEIYELTSNDGNSRILSGSKGIGRFALARLGENADVETKKQNTNGVKWTTDWNQNFISPSSKTNCGTIINIENLRDSWNKKQIDNLSKYLSTVYNDNQMKVRLINNIDVKSEEIDVVKVFENPILRINCKSIIKLKYDSQDMKLSVDVVSDEFKESVSEITKQDIKKHFEGINILEKMTKKEMTPEEHNQLRDILMNLGSFHAELYFDVKSTQIDQERFHYKDAKLPESYEEGVILYRNSFSISSFEGSRDWLKLGDRARKSPAAASHPTGSWRVRFNNLSGKVVIDKSKNSELRDMSNRQGIEENVYFNRFVEIIQNGIASFEKYRQTIVRILLPKGDDNQMKDPDSKVSVIVSSITKDHNKILQLEKEESLMIAQYVGESIKKIERLEESYRYKEENYKYDVAILNVLATSYLRVLTQAHELHNDRNQILSNVELIINKLKEFGLWDILNEDEKTKYAATNVPKMLLNNKRVNEKIVYLINVMLSEVQKDKFKPYKLNLRDQIMEIRDKWINQYKWVTIDIRIPDHAYMNLAPSTILVIFDNLILNSIQQNDKENTLNIVIETTEDNLIFTQFHYSDNGKGLDKKYKMNPMKILEVHESNREEGHGLGMWIVNNTIISSGGKIDKIYDDNGFNILFDLKGDK